jgi:hypothetical protein
LKNKTTKELEHFFKIFVVNSSEIFFKIHKKRDTHSSSSKIKIWGLKNTKVAKVTSIFRVKFIVLYRLKLIFGEIIKYILLNYIYYILYFVTSETWYYYYY